MKLDDAGLRFQKRSALHLHAVPQRRAVALLVVFSGLKTESREIKPVCGCKRPGFRVVECTLCSIVEAALAGAGGVIWLRQGSLGQLKGKSEG